MGKSVQVIGNDWQDWTGPDGSEWLVELTWARLDGRAECVGIELRSFIAADGDVRTRVGDGDAAKPVKKGGAVRPLKAQVLRALTMSVIAERRSAWVDVLGDDGPFGDHPEADRRRAARAMFEKKSGRRLAGADGAPMATDEALARVAEVYVRARGRHVDPTLAVSEAFHLSRSAAAKRVGRARGAGLLTRTHQGRPGGRLTEKCKQLLDGKEV